MKVVYTGLESSGKSLLLARKARQLVKRNSKWFNITGVKRPIRSNLIFSPSFVEYAENNNVPILYWTNLEEIIYHQECDVFIDELLKYFDARLWQNLSLDAKHWLTQGAKTGVHVYATAQDFSQVEKQFRILCSKVYMVNKLIGSPRPMKTAPDVKYIWGICLTREVAPKSFKGDSATMEVLSFVPSPFLILKEDTEIFNTNAKVVPSDLPIKRKRKQVIHFVEGEKIVKETFVWT